MTETPVESRTQKKRTNPLVLVLLAVLIAGGFALGYYLIQVKKPLMENEQLNQQLVSEAVGLAAPSSLRMDETFRDRDGDGVADPPTDPGSLIDPPTLVFSYVAIEDPEKYKEAFTEFVAYLSKATGKPVEYGSFKTPGQELKAMREGQLHIAGFNTGNVPLAVNWAGFVPVCRLASSDGVNMYQMEIIVPADSRIQQLSDLRDHELTLTEAGSNSGFKAPLVLLAKDNGLRPVADFKIRYSGGHLESILGIANKQYEAAAVANDVLSRELGVGTIKKDQYRSIYKSENFPTAGFGYVYNLKPELAKKIKDAMFSFNWEGTKMAKEFAPSNQSKFVPVNYKNDWALVRRIDSEIRGTQSLESLMSSAEASEEGASTQPVEAAPSTQQAAPPTGRGR